MTTATILTSPGTPDVTSFVAQQAAATHGFTDAASIDLIAVSENATYRVSEDMPSGHRRMIIRVHRLNYHDAHSVKGEIQWLNELRDHPFIKIAAPIETPDGRTVLELPTPYGTRCAVAFEEVPGKSPESDNLSTDDFFLLGQLAAELHKSVTTLTTPVQRFHWDWKNTLGETPRWGRWQDGPGATQDMISRTMPAVKLLYSKLVIYGKAPHRYNLIHSDLRLANLLAQDHDVTVIDFDDCGYGWFMYDFASAISFLETDPRVPQWQAAWLTGYEKVRTLSAEDIKMIPSFIILRRLMFLAWLGSHPHAVEYPLVAPTYAKETAVLAEAFVHTTGLMGSVRKSA